MTLGHLARTNLRRGCRAVDGITYCRPRAAGGRPLAGLEFVEKLLTTNLASTDTTERKAGMLRRIRTVASVELAKTS
jgi:hypothetical protein